MNCQGILEALAAIALIDKNAASTTVQSDAYLEPGLSCDYLWTQVMIYASDA